MALTFSHCATLVYVPYACPATVPVPMCLFLSSISPTSPKRHASEPALDTAAVGWVSPKVPSSLGHQHAIPTQWFNRGAQTNRVQRQGQPTLTTTTATWNQHGTRQLPKFPRSSHHSSATITSTIGRKAHFRSTPVDTPLTTRTARLSWVGDTSNTCKQNRPSDTRIHLRVSQYGGISSVLCIIRICIVFCIVFCIILVVTR